MTDLQNAMQLRWLRCSCFNRNRNQRPCCITTVSFSDRTTQSLHSSNLPNKVYVMLHISEPNIGILLVSNVGSFRDHPKCFIRPFAMKRIPWKGSSKCVSSDLRDSKCILFNPNKRIRMRETIGKIESTSNSVKFILHSIWFTTTLNAFAILPIAPLLSASLKPSAPLANQSSLITHRWSRNHVFFE